VSIPGVSSLVLMPVRLSCHCFVTNNTRYSDLITGWTVRGSNPGRGEIFPTRLDRPRGPTSLLYNGYRVSFPGVKWPGHGFDRPFPPSAEVKERVELYLCFLCGPSWCVTGRTSPFLHLPLTNNVSEWLVDTFASYVADARLKSRFVNRISWSFSWFSSVSVVKCRILIPHASYSLIISCNVNRWQQHYINQSTVILYRLIALRVCFYRRTFLKHLKNTSDTSAL
jgi:hypothetical protein